MKCVHKTFILLIQTPVALSTASHSARLQSCVCGSRRERKRDLLSAFDHIDFSSDSKSGCVLYLGIELFQLSELQSGGAYYIWVRIIFGKLR